MERDATSTFDAAVLTGGTSRRMGVDKALLRPWPGAPTLSELVADALLRAGARRVLAIGGDAGALAASGLVPVMEPLPGAGPLSGIIGALRATSDEAMVIAPCDLPDLDPALVEQLWSARRLEEADVAVPVVDGVRQVVVGAWRTACLQALEAALAAGERSVHGALTGLHVAEVAALDEDRLSDLDDPADLDRYARRRHTPGGLAGTGFERE